MADLFNLPGFSWFIQKKKNGNLQKQILCFPTERPVSILWAKKLELNNMYNRSRCSYYSVAWCFEKRDSMSKINALIHLLQCV